MARGWESKSVESQIEDADLSSDRKEPITQELGKAQQKRQSLELSRRRILSEIAATQSAMRRTSLQQALAFLDEEIEKLGV